MAGFGAESHRTKAISADAIGQVSANGLQNADDRGGSSCAGASEGDGKRIVVGIVVRDVQRGRL